MRNDGREPARAERDVGAMVRLGDHAVFRVLTMDALPGIRSDDVEALNEAGRDCSDLAYRLADVLIRML